tara:strand:+ start:2266 stop:2664 length:399 start_codon:yes stop_codon:yes gene_type:complete
MDKREIQELINKPRPAPEEHVDIECSGCAGQWCAVPRTSAFAPSEGIHEVEFKTFVGFDHCHITELGVEFYTCPNGCNYMGVPKKLHGILEAGNPTPTDRWEFAQLLYRKQQLEDELDSVEMLMENYRGMYF